MNIDQMTYGELKQIAAMFPTNAGTSNIASPVLGKYCIARCYSAGVHAGIVSAVNGENVVLTDSRRLWSWEAKNGVALSGLAQNGLKTGKVDSENPVIYLTGVCELIPCTEKAEDTIRHAK
jgi:hypothetical protein